MDFLGIGPLELLLILIVLLIFVGPARLPEIAGMIGKGIHKLKEATTELTNDFKEMADELKDAEKEVNSTVKPSAELPERLRDVTKEIEDVRKEINIAVKTDIGLTRDLKKVLTASEKSVKEANTVPKPVPEEEVSTRKEEGGMGG